MGIDEGTVRFLAEHRVAVLDWLTLRTMDAGTTSAGLVLVVVMASAVVVVTRQWWAALCAGLAFMAVTVVGAILKVTIGRPRPSASLAMVDAVGYSMPSLNAAQVIAGAVAFGLMLELPSRRGTVVITLCMSAVVVWVSFSVVYLGAHWPSDVLAGWVLGALVGGATAFAGRHVRSRIRGRGPDQFAAVPTGPS